MELLLPESFVNKVIDLITNNLPFYGMEQASMMTGIRSEIGTFLKDRSTFTISSTELDEAYRNGKGKQIDQQLMYAMNATPLYQEYLFLEKYSELSSKNQINIETLCDFFMKRIYALTLQNGHSTTLSSEGFQEYFSLPDEKKVRNIFQILEKTDLIDVTGSSRGGTIFYTISGLGEHHVEKGGETGILKSYLNKENLVIMDKRVFVTNSTGVQVNVDSEHPTQTVIINDNNSLFKTLDKMIEVLQQNSTLGDEEMKESILNIQSLKTEVQKSKPNFEYVRDCLAIAANSLKISEYVPAIATYLIARYPDIEQFIKPLL